jgi:hypothetical protein
MKQTLGQDLLMRSIKIIDIGYIAVIYMAFSFFFAFLTDKIMGKFDEKKETAKPKWQLTLEVIIAVWAYGVLIYIVRNLVEVIPFPLDGYQGFEHKRVKELGSAIIFSFTYLLFSSYLKSKLSYYYNYISSTISVRPSSTPVVRIPKV